MEDFCMLNRLRKYMPRGKKSLQARFQVGLAVILFLFCLIAVVAVYSLQRNMLEREALRQTNLVMNSLQATRGYVREILRPKMYQILPDNSFVIESMSSSYITRVIMENLKEDLPEFDYRRVAFNPRNPEFAPDRLEEKMIVYFRENTAETTWSGVVRIGSKQHFIRYEPVRFTRSCLLCHGRPDSAPNGIINRYGSSGGFHHKAGEIAGVVSISIPLERDLAGIRTSVFWLFAGILGSGLLLFLFIHLFFQQLVIVNLHSLMSFFRETVSDAHGSELYEKMSSKDEISEMSEGIRLLAEHIGDTRKQLEHYAVKLEETVAQRTEALVRSHDQLRRQVRQRNTELQLFTTIAELNTGTEPLPEILSCVLKETLKVVPAQGGAIYLWRDSSFEICCATGILSPPQIFDPMGDGSCSSREQIAMRGCNYIRFLDDDEATVAIPLCCRNVTLGVLLIAGLDREHFEEPLRDLLVSIGNQIGIVVESIQNTGALRHSEQLLRSVFKGISDPLVLLDANGRFRMANEAFLHRHELEMAEVINRSVEDLVNENSWLLARTAVRFDTNARQPHNETFEDDEGNCFDVHFYPVLTDDGEVTSVICFSRDVTETKKVEQQMRQTEKLAAVGQLAAGVAHELNNPLWVVLCHTDIIKNDFPETPELLKDISIIERHSKHCQRIVSDLLNFTRNQEQETPRQPLRVEEDIRQVIAMVENQFRKKNITLAAEFDESEPVCLVDPARIQQVLLNLLINAGQAIGSDGKITLTTKTTGDHVIISIEDDGPGIEREVMDKVFDPFFTTKKQGEGTGLGLSVSYGIIRDHGGQIEVASQPGKTVFTLSLPLHKENHDV